VLSIPEPLGHDKPKSKFERLWDQIPRGNGFFRRRVEKFDGEYMIAFSPTEYVLRDIGSSTTDFTPEMLLSHFVEFVRDEMSESGHDLISRYPGPPHVSARETALLSDVMKYIEDAEQYFVYGQFMKDLRRRSPTEDRLGNFVFNVLCNEIIGNEANKRHLDLKSFVRKIEADEHEQKRLLFVFLGLPFKDQNPLRTDAPPSHVDFAEIGLLIQLHIQALAFHQDHPFGTDFVVLSDGKLYSRVFGVEWAAADTYVSRVREMRNRLNLQASVHVIDLEECILKLPEREVEQFDHVKNLMKKLLSDSEILGSDNRLQSSFESLKRGMRRNINTRETLKTLEWHEQVQLIGGVNLQTGGRLKAIARDLDERCTQAALEYASTNVALRVFRVVERVFPDAIRATVHPKVGQVAIPRSGSAYPWNGIGVWAPAKGFPKAIECREFGELSRLNRAWCAGYFPGDSYPAYYRTVEAAQVTG